MKLIVKILSILVTLVVPFILIMMAIRLLINPLFLTVEYNLPNFPSDPYGFTTAERLKWGELSMDYLINSEPDDYLATLKFEDGTPLYNERELSHMLDVRVLVQSALTAWYILLGVTLLLGLTAWKFGYLKELWKSITLGGWLTLGVIFLVILSTFIDFSALFTAFHGLFFQGDTWLFYESDTLIRLYPLKFWSDAFIYVGVMTII
jgi:integral membrane protein (TIGR01906 family)